MTKKMGPNELADKLLALPSDEERRNFLNQHRSAFNIELLEALKARSDALLLRDPHYALKVASVALQAASFIDTPLARGLALWAQGNALLFLGRYRQSLTAYREAQAIYEQANRRLEVARLLVNQVAALWHLAEYAEALRIASLAREYLEPLGPTRYLATLEMNVGAIHRQQGNYEQALAAYARGREIFAALGDRIQAARMDVNRANVLENLDRFAEAESLLEAARATLYEQGMALEVARVDLNLGITTFRQGRYQTALRHFERAHDGFEALRQNVEMAVVDLYCAQAYLGLNLLPEAIHLARGARRVLARQGLKREATLCLATEARALHRQGDLLAAMRVLNRARRAYRQMSAPVEVALLDIERAELLREAGEIRSGWRIAKRAARLLASYGLPARSAWAQIVQARCALELRWFDRARELAQSALETGESLGLAEVLWPAHHLLGQVSERIGQKEAALEAYRAAIAAIEQLSATLPGDEFRAGFLADKLVVYEDAVRTALSLGQEGEAFNLTQAMVAAMALGVPVKPRAPLSDADERLWQRLETLRRAWHWKRSHLEKLTPPTEHPSRTEETIRSELKALEEEIAELWRRWRVRQVEMDFSLPGFLPLRDLQGALASDEAFVQYVVVNGKVGAFIVREKQFEYRGGLAAVSEVARLMDAWRFTLEMFRLYPAEALRPHMDAWCDDAKAHLYRLYKFVFEPLEKLLVGIERLRVVPHPALPLTPFAALHDGTDYLLERFEITWLPAPAALHNRLTPSPRGYPVVVGCSDEGRLPYAVLEAKRVADALRSQAPVLLVEDAATERELRQHLSSCNLLHLATHSAFRGDNPFFSWVRLADAYLTVADFYALTLPAHPLIVLSACETGLTGRQGGGLIGLSRALLAAGASALIVSLWKVDDASTAELMGAFYREYVAGASPATALRRAQQYLLSKHPHPFYWAPFVFIGQIP